MAWPIKSTSQLIHPFKMLESCHMTHLQACLSCPLFSTTLSTAFKSWFTRSCRVNSLSPPLPVPRLVRRFSLGGVVVALIPPSQGAEEIESEELTRMDPVSELALEVVSPDVRMMVRLLSWRENCETRLISRTSPSSSMQCIPSFGLSPETLGFVKETAMFSSLGRRPLDPLFSLLAFLQAFCRAWTMSAACVDVQVGMCEQVRVCVWCVCGWVCMCIQCMCECGCVCVYGRDTLLTTNLPCTILANWTHDHKTLYCHVQLKCLEAIGENSPANDLAWWGC